MKTPKFNIGDTVWVACSSAYSEVWVTCPHCFGKKFLTVILGDDSKITIDCECCKEGWQGCRGMIQEYQFVARAYETVISEVELRNEKFQYNNNDEENVFATKAESESRAETFSSSL